MAHVVILCAGTGSMPAAYEMCCILAKEHKVTVLIRMIISCLLQLIHGQQLVGVQVEILLSH
jgi:hypothetical protein